jgi:hypothetical protein
VLSHSVIRKTIHLSYPIVNEPTAIVGHGRGGRVSVNNFIVMKKKEKMRVGDELELTHTKESHPRLVNLSRRKRPAN